MRGGEILRNLSSIFSTLDPGSQISGTALAAVIHIQLPVFKMLDSEQLLAAEILNRSPCKIRDSWVMCVSRYVTAG